MILCLKPQNSGIPGTWTPQNYGHHVDIYDISVIFWYVQLVQLEGFNDFEPWPWQEYPEQPIKTNQDRHDSSRDKTDTQLSHWNFQVALDSGPLPRWQVDTWRIIPLSKKLGSPPFISHKKAIWKRKKPVRGLTNHGHEPLTNWDDPPSSLLQKIFSHCLVAASWCWWLNRFYIGISDVCDNFMLAWGFLSNIKLTND